MENHFEDHYPRLSSVVFALAFTLTGVVLGLFWIIAWLG